MKPRRRSLDYKHASKMKIDPSTHDEAARGNPGKDGIGCIFRDSEGKVLGSLAQGLGLVINYTAECKPIIKGVELASSNGWLIAWVESDSKSAVKAFNSNNILWTWKLNGLMLNELCNKLESLPHGEKLTSVPMLSQYTNSTLASEIL
ncbi:hypothetical protein GIB67_014911 [Kingdonia uniflora]|uniref:RNase H type-1 domain-containing protein n=1 Tax=Kingdonia uniflora TaxID=39325 RepID=A0A7J7MTG8_9MAGN|nr:hypothetical protein GIB67_014911 [Kingdonia uniflora]